MSYNHVIHNILRALTEETANKPEDLFETEEYKEDGFSVIDCPICGKKTMDMYWICSGCNWEYDIFIDYESDDEYSDCNGTTLGEYKNVYRILSEVLKKSKAEERKDFYLITCYRKDFTWESLNEKTYGAFERFEDCVTALKHNQKDMHAGVYDFAVVNKIDLNSNVEELRWFIWDEQKQGFSTTDQEADWTSGWVQFERWERNRDESL